ncbi:MAG: hypothetical protein LW884_11200 [Bacteroidetes bacterium]|jgi:hypothetical protein|nr:hypothetical protein [Bacteroidota bacterium]
MKKHLLLFTLGLLMATAAMGQAKKCLTTGVIEHNDGNYAQALAQLKCAADGAAELKEADQSKAHYYYALTWSKIYSQNVQVDPKDAAGNTKPAEQIQKEVQGKIDGLMAKYPNITDEMYASYKFVYENDASKTYKENPFFKGQIMPFLLQLTGYQVALITNKKDLKVEDLHAAVEWSRKFDFVSSSSGSGLARVSPKIQTANLLLATRLPADSLAAEKELAFFEENYPKVLTPELMGNEIVRKAVGESIAQGVAIVVRYYTSTGRVEQAKAAASKGLETLPGNQTILDAESDIYLHPSQVDKALQRFKDELAADPTSVQRNLKMAQVSRRVADRYAEEKLTGRIDSLKKNQDNLSKEQMKTLVGEIKVEMQAFIQKSDEAHGYYGTALQQTPTNAEKHLALFNQAAISNNVAKYYSDFYNALPWQFEKEAAAALDTRTTYLEKAFQEVEAAHAVLADDLQTLNVCYQIALALGNEEKAAYYKGLQDAQE